MPFLRMQLNGFSHPPESIKISGPQGMGNHNECSERTEIDAIDCTGAVNAKFDNKKK